MDAQLPSPGLTKFLKAPLFNRNRRMFTRFQERRIRAIFDFLGLPGELREIIYGLLVNFDGLDKYFNNAYRMVSRARNSYTADKQKPRVVRFRTPSIFLVCRQITNEVSAVFRNKNVDFNHGLLRIEYIDKVMSPSLINRLGSITITVKGHEILQDNICRTSFLGYTDLILNLAYCLSQGHRLKQLTIDLTDDEFKKHITRCWDGHVKCEFINIIKRVFGELKDRVRDVGCVTIKGIEENLAREVTLALQSKSSLFLKKLPRKVRDMIYDLVVDYHGINPNFAKTVSTWVVTSHKPTVPYTPKRTPSILLLNRQITREARSVLDQKQLTLVCPAVVGLTNQNVIPNLLNFVSPATFQTVKHLSITVESWEWLFAIENLLKCLVHKHELKSFYFALHDRMKANFTGVIGKQYPDVSIATCLHDLQNLRGLQTVMFEGDLPDVYTLPLVSSMRAQRGASGWNLPPPMAVRWDGVVVNVRYDWGY